MSTKKIILTTEEFLVIKNKLEEIKSDIYKTDFKLENSLDKNFTQDQKNMLVQDLDLNAGSADIEKSIDAILHKLSNTDIVSIKVPFEPSVMFIGWVKEFLQEKTASSSSNLLIHIQTDKSLLAGVYVEYKGKIKSQSIKNAVLNILSGDK